MPYLLDTDLVIDHLQEVPETVTLLEGLLNDGLAISMVTYMEVYQGVLRDPAPREAEAKFRTFLSAVDLLPFSQGVAERCAALREQLRRDGKRVNSRALDLINAATALEYNLTLVTRNAHDYQDIPNLNLYGGTA